MTSAGVALSLHPDAGRALRSAARAARKRAGDGPAALVCVVVTAAHDIDRIAADLDGLFGDAPVIGCSVERLLVEADDVRSPHGVSVVWLPGPRAELTAGPGKGRGAELTMTERPWTGDVPGVVVVASGDRPRVFAGGAAAPGTVTAALPGRSWRTTRARSMAPIGPIMRVTACDGPQIHSLDDRPAYDVLSAYVAPGGMHGERLPVALGRGQEIFSMRAVGSPGERSLLCDATLERGAEVQLLMTDRETILEEGDRVAGELEGASGSLLLCTEGVAGPGEETDRWDRVRVIAEAVREAPFLCLRGGGPDLTAAVLA